jgi:hypothetical protein
MRDHTTATDTESEVTTAAATTSKSTTFETLTDPTTLVDRDDVDYREHTFVHESTDHCERDYAGRAIVGVTNDAGEVLLLVHEENDGAVLPNAKVEPGDDWVAAGVGEVERVTGVAAEIESVERLRIADHRLEDEDSPFQTTTHVLFRARPLSADEPSTDIDEVTAGWFDEPPAASATGDRPVDHDVRLFFD